MAYRVGCFTFSVILLVVALPERAFAWDFSCSPRTSTSIELAPPPNIMLMLDRSGSMDGGERVRSCKVCEEPDGTRYEVDSVAACSPRGARWDRAATSSFGRDNGLSGYSHSLVFDSLPSVTEDLTLELEIGGDSGGRCEWYDISIDGVFFESFNPRFGGASCQKRSTQITIPATFAADGRVVVDIVASPDSNACNGDNIGCARNSNCDGVDATCDTNSADGVLRHSPRVYWGTQTWNNPCGTEDKWEQSVTAIDALTREGQATSPEQAHFGFGYYHQNATSRILQDCRPGNHAAIMNSLNPLGPNGGTPTALGIRTAARSRCVADAGHDTITRTKIVPRDPSNSGYDQTFDFIGLTPGVSGAEITVEFWGDFGSACEFAYVIIDGIVVGDVTGTSDCNTPGNPNVAKFAVPPAAIADGAIEVVFDTRASSDSSLSPACSPGNPHVNAYCGTNGATVTLRTPTNDGKGAATVLINDGAPTKSLDGREARHATIHEACQHRRVANLYVVGLGAGTDEDFNNILAAAGGTGTCTVGGREVDPCADPADWATLRGDCSGSFQADDGAAMLAALAAITDEIACTYPVDFTNSNRDAVPADPASSYDYVWVEVRRSDTGALERVYHVDSPANPTPGLGWDFASSNRKEVRMSPGYCNLVNSGAVEVVDTQLACLCQEVPGSDCTVPGANILGVCPDGEWICVEGIDICEPELTCCQAGLPCDTGLEGVCAAGRTRCAGNIESCVPLTEPSAEVCDGLDNDCDGIVDELDAEECVVAGQVGRCAAGNYVCDGNDRVCAQTRQPLPELCNGLDDDCDGRTDNITESWEKPLFSSIAVTDEVEPLACAIADSCRCPDGTDDHAGQNFEEYVDEWDPVCVCGDAIEWAEGEDRAGSPNNTEPRAGCATGSSAPQGAALLLLAALFATRLRRRRRSND